MLMRPTAPCQIDGVRLREALHIADIRLLLPVLVQLTGDLRWLTDRYRPKPIRGMLVDDGGLDDEVLGEIRDAAHAAIMAWAAGATDPAVPQPTGPLLRRLIAFATGDPVPDGYAEMHAEDMGFADKPAAAAPTGGPPEFTVVVIGAGLGGLLAALRLREAGVRHIVLEQNDTVGGTWRDNRYPGCGVDVPSHLYSFSFFPRNWPRHFAPRDDVASYIRDFFTGFELGPSVRFGTEVTGAEWNEESRTWTVRTRRVDGSEESLVAEIVISAVGIFGHPKVPDIPGRDRFTGEVFHSACWPEHFDHEGKRIAVVGSGASAMQIVPAIVDQVSDLAVYQRSAQWVSPMPTYGEAVDPDLRWLIEQVPFYHQWMRFRLAWVFSDRLYPSLQIDPDWTKTDSINAHNERHRRFLLDYIHTELAGRDGLIEKALPDYPPYGKRMLLDNGWFAAIRQPHVELVTTGIREFTEKGLMDDEGVERPADAVVFSTGFEVTRYLLPMDIRGRGGEGLREVWDDDDARAYLGVAAPPGFPNLFFVYGPNTNGIGGSYMLLAEVQMDYIMRLISEMAAGRVAAVEPTPERFTSYNLDVDAAHERLIWRHPKVSTFYRNARGRVVVNSPWTVQGYWERLQNVDLGDYTLTPAADDPAGSTG